MNVRDVLTLVEYNQWANGRILRRAANLPPDELTAPCWLSGGSLINTLIHTLDAQWSWRLACQSGEMPGEQMRADQFADVGGLRAWWVEEDAKLIDYVQSLSNEALGHVVTYQWPRARPRTKILWHILVHIVNHGTHHRSEIGQYLGTLGRSPGDLDFTIYLSKQTQTQTR